jgi:hypothetical protein
MWYVNRVMKSEKGQAEIRVCKCSVDEIVGGSY